MIWILPMAGKGRRTNSLGKFKPFVKVNGKKIIEWFLISIKNKIKKNDIIVLITTIEYEKKNNFQKKVKLVFKKNKLKTKNLIFKFINETPNGPAYTVSSIKNILRNSKVPCVVINPDQFIDFDLPNKFNRNSIYIPLYFNNHGNSSYVKLNSQGNIIEIKEKILISNYASSGVYIFSSSTLLKKILGLINKIRPKKEVNMSDLINLFIKRNKKKVKPITTLTKYDLGNIKNIKNFIIKDLKVI